MYYIKRIKVYIRNKIFKKPTQVLLEPTNRCNLNCPFCMVGMQNELHSKYGKASHSLMSRVIGNMSEDIFRVVLEKIKDFGIKKVYLHFQGEPLLNELTPKYAKKLKQNKFEVGIFTNGMAFTKDNIKELVDAEIDLIRFSVDGASQETYKKNRVGGDFNEVYGNMNKIALANKNNETRIEWQFLALKNNEHEIEKAKELASKIGVKFFVKGYRETDPELRTINKIYHAKYLKKPCKDIYHQIGIYWNADVVPCCYDVDGKEIMGNLLRNSLKDIWNNKKYREFRKRVDNAINDPENEPDICKNCLRWK